MASYVVPQVEVHQLFSEIPVSLATTQVPFVFGPNYQLHRYSDASEKAGTEFGFWDSEVNVEEPLFAPYPDALDEEKVDKSYTKMFGDNVYVQLGTFATVKRVVSDAGSSSSELDDKYYDDVLDIVRDTASSSSEEPDHDEIAVGRMLRLVIGTGANETHKDVKIIKIDVEKSTEDFTRIQIDEDLDQTTKIEKAYLCEVQNGVEFPRKDFTDENKTRYFWEEMKDTTVGSKTYGHYGIKVNGQLYAYYVDSDYSELTVKYGKVLSADLYLTYRELLTAASDTIHALTAASEVADALGTVHPDNPLAQAVYNAALNAGGQTIRYMAVDTADLSVLKNDEDADLEGYNSVLDKATLTKEVYFLVPVTRNHNVLTLVKSHVEAMSAATVKRWRIAFISDEIPETDPLYTSANNPDGDDFYARVESVEGSGEEKTADIWFYDKIETEGETQYRESEYTSFKKNIKEGDIVYINWKQEWGVQVPTVVKVKKYINNSRIRVYDPDNELSVMTDYSKSEIYHPYTKTETAEQVKNLSSFWASRRMYNVFPSVFTTGGVQQTGEFAAACVAGLVSSCLPQQPVTNLELTGIDDIPLVYQTFSYDELNTMASGGTFIVMQDLPGDQVYVRHQISTDYEANNLNTAELSITKNLDSISYFFDDLLSPYIGKYNITPELLLTLRSVINSGITSLSSNSYGLYGSQLIADGTEILLLEQDSLLKDHVNCNMQLNMPYPFNHLVLKLFV